jgi:DeoR/GlpR family transcriptional regulator of sugar metabolism
VNKTHTKEGEVAKMFADERYKVIQNMLNEKGSVTVSELLDKFQISIETVRRDLITLEKQGILKRVHGGAVKTLKMKEFHDIQFRKNEFSDEKFAIAEAAMALIKDGDIISIDSGSTAVVFAKVLMGKFNHLIVITHSLEVFKELEGEHGIKRILVGGEYLESEGAFYGDLATSCLDGLQIGKAFIFPSAISLTGGAMDFVTELVPVQKKFISKANQVYLLADSSKIETTALLKICELQACDEIITDSKLDNSIFERYKQSNINITK